jgi:hypothetical protein
LVKHGILCETRPWSAGGGRCELSHHALDDRHEGTLAGLQMDLSGIIGPLFAGLLIPLAGASFIFGVNGLGFLFMFLAFLQWKRVRAQSNLPLENFFESLTTAIRYVRYTPGIKILLARHSLFSFFIAIIPSLTTPVIPKSKQMRRIVPNPPALTSKQSAALPGLAQKRRGSDGRFSQRGVIRLAMRSSLNEKCAT